LPQFRYDSLTLCIECGAIRICEPLFYEVIS
jgi:hypothetical protein